MSKIVKKNIRQFLLIASLLILALQFQTVLAEGPFVIPDATKYGDIPGAPTGDTTIQRIANLIGGYRAGDTGIFGIARVILGAIAILMIIVSSLRMLFADGEEGTTTKAKDGILAGVAGLALISISGELTKILSLSDEGIKAAYNGETAICYKTILSDPNAMQCRAKLFSRTVQIIITFLKYLIGSIAILQVIVSAFRLATLGDDPQKLDADKKKVIWGALGFLLIILSDTIVNKVFYKLNYDTYTGVDGVSPAVDPAEGVKQIVGFTNFIISIVGPLAVLTLIVGGVMYMAAAGEDGKMQEAKRIIIAGVIGIIVIYGAFGLVSTVIAGKF